MKRSATVLGLVAALMIPASLAVAQADDAPQTKQIRLGDGTPLGCSYFIEKGELKMIRLQTGAQSRTGSRFGEGPMGSEAAPFQRQGFGPGECIGECDGDGPFGPFGPNAEEAPYGPFGDQDGDGTGYGPGECVGECNGDGPFGPNAEEAPYGPFGDQDGDGTGYGPAATGHGPGPQDGTGPIQAGTQDGIGNEFGPGSDGNASASPGGSTNQNGAGPGGHK